MLLLLEGGQWYFALLGTGIFDLLPCQAGQHQADVPAASSLRHPG